MYKFIFVSLLFFMLNQVLFSQGVMFRRIMIDPGHGGSDVGSPGWNNDPTYPNESDINLNVGLYLRNILQNQLALIQMTRTADVDFTPEERQEMINIQKPEAMVSIHFNADSNATIQGTETFWYKNSIADGKNLAGQIQDELLMIGYRDRGVKIKGWTVLNVDALVAASLSESMFITEVNGWYKMTFAGGIIGNQQVATYINNGLIHYFDGVPFPFTNLLDIKKYWNFNIFPFITAWGFTWGSGGNKSKDITYTVYSSDDPYLALENWDIEAENITDTFYEAQIVDNKKFYRVMMNDNDSLTYSDKIGYIKQICVTTSSKNLNLISLPLFESEFEFVSDISTLYQDRIESISRWDESSQTWKTASNTFLGWVDNYEVEENDTYMINITDYIEFLNSGIIYEQDQYYLRNNENGNNNFITIPLNKFNLSTSELFGNDIGTCNSVSKWSSSNQSWDTSIYTAGWNNIFNTEIGLPYVVAVTENTFYPESKNTRNFSSPPDSKDVSEINTPRKIIYHAVDNSGSEITNITDITFETYIKSRLDDKQFSNFYTNTKTDTLKNMLYVETNAGNFTNEWATGDILHFEVTQISTGLKGRGDVLLDNSADAIIKGYESILPGSGNPIKISEFGTSQLQIASINNISSNIVIKWHPLTGANSYLVYSSNVPYNSFAIDLSGSFNDTTWTSPIIQSKKFYYVVGINSDKGTKTSSGFIENLLKQK